MMRGACRLSLDMISCLPQSFLKHKDAKPLRDVLAANPNRFITLLLPGGTQAAVRPGSPSTSTMRLDLQFQAIKVRMPTVDFCCPGEFPSARLPCLGIPRICPQIPP